MEPSRRTTPAYIQAFLTDTLAKHILLLHSIPALHDLQASWLLLLFTASPRCNYLLRLLPPWQLFGRRGQTPCQFYINKRRLWRQHSATNWLIQPAYPTPKGPSKPENANLRPHPAWVATHSHHAPLPSCQGGPL